MMSGFARGTEPGQDARFADKAARGKRAIAASAPPEYGVKITMSRVARPVIEGWVNQRIPQLLGVEDDVVTGLVAATLADEHPDPAALQHTLTGFLEGNAAPFVVELWRLLASAQESAHGIPAMLLEVKKEQLRAAAGGGGGGSSGSGVGAAAAAGPAAPPPPPPAPKQAVVVIVIDVVGGGGAPRRRRRRCRVAPPTHASHGGSEQCN